MKVHAKQKAYSDQNEKLKSELMVEIRMILDANKEVGNQLLTAPGVKNSVLSSKQVGKMNKRKCSVDELLEMYGKLIPYENPKKKK